MARLLRVTILIAFFLHAGKALAAGGTCPTGADYSGPAEFSANVTLASLGITNCYFIAANGSDSNSGTSESSPWAHIPGSPLCTSACASTNPAGGTGFIFRGGDTWGASNFTINWKWSGTSSNPIYIGVDPNWYSGSSWARPIWNAQQNNSASYMWNSGNSNYYLDNIEIVGQYMPQGGDFHTIVLCGQNVFAENFYVHGWSHASGVSGNTNGTTFYTCGGSNVQGLTVRYNVVDGSDTTKDQMTSVYYNTPNLYGNYFHYVVTASNGCGDNWHDNVVDTIVIPATGPAHQDGLYQYGPCYSGTPLIYNNVIRNATDPRLAGSVKLWLSGNNCNSATGYAFNNILYNNYPGNMVDTGGHFACSYGTWNFFNNTVDCGTDSNQGACIVGDNGNTGGSMTINLQNNHWITTGSILSCTKTYSCHETNDVQQTLDQANSQGYSDSSAYAFQPTSASGSTVTTIANAAIAASRQSLCTAVGVVNAVAGAACQSDTTYACTYDTTNHAVHCPARDTVARAAEPNVGAYQFSSVQASTPNPPAGLTVSVQ